MSMNLSLIGERDIFIPAINKHDIQEVSINLYQTPTVITYKALDSNDAMNVYKEYVYSTTNKKRAKEHLDDIQKQMKEYEQEGYVFDFYMV